MMLRLQTCHAAAIWHILAAETKPKEARSNLVRSPMSNKTQSVYKAAAMRVGAALPAVACSERWTDAYASGSGLKAGVEAVT